MLAGLLDRPRFEVLPTAGVTDAVMEHVPAGRTVTVTASPARGLDATVHISMDLARAGYLVVPHLAARMVRDHAELADLVARLQSVGVTQVFVPSGDEPAPGEFPDALALLHALDDLGRPFSGVGVTAYPESHPTISDEAIIQAMWDKRHHASELVSNLAFDSQVVAAWLPEVRRRGIDLPLWLGVPGAVSTARLLKLATRVGVGESARFALKNPSRATKLLGRQRNSAEVFLRDLSPMLARPDSGIAGLHLFTFNQVAQTEAWRVDLLTRLREGGGPLR